MDRAISGQQVSLKRGPSIVETYRGRLRNPHPRNRLIAIARVHLFADLFLLHLKHRGLRTCGQNRQGRAQTALAIRHIHRGCDTRCCLAHNLGPMGQKPRDRESTTLARGLDAGLHQGRGTGKPVGGAIVAWLFHI